jgi:hypothetical protein
MTYATSYSPIFKLFCNVNFGFWVKGVVYDYPKIRSWNSWAMKMYLAPR